MKALLKVSWDELVIEAVSTHYELDKAMMALPKKEKLAEKEGGGVQEEPKESSKKGEKKGRKSKAAVLEG